MINNIVIWPVFAILSIFCFLIGVAADLAFYATKTCFALIFAAMIFGAAAAFLASNPNLF